MVTLALLLSPSTIGVIVLAAAIAYAVVAWFFAKKAKVDAIQEGLAGAAAVFDAWQFDRVASVVRSVAVTNFIAARQKLEKLWDEYQYAPNKDECVLAWLWPSFIHQLPVRLDPKRPLFAAECDEIVKAIVNCPEARDAIVAALGEKEKEHSA